MLIYRLSVLLCVVGSGCSYARLSFCTGMDPLFQKPPAAHSETVPKRFLQLFLLDVLYAVLAISAAASSFFSLASRMIRQILSTSSSASPSYKGSVRMLRETSCAIGVFPLQAL